MVTSGSRSRSKRTSVSKRSKKTARTFMRSERLAACISLVEPVPVPDRLLAEFPAEVHLAALPHVGEIHQPLLEVLRDASQPGDGVEPGPHPLDQPLAALLVRDPDVAIEGGAARQRDPLLRRRHPLLYCHRCSPSA